MTRVRRFVWRNWRGGGVGGPEGRVKGEMEEEGEKED